MLVPSRIHFYFTLPAAADAAKSCQSCLTLCGPRESSPPGSHIPGILQARTLEWVAISFSNVWKWKVKVKSLSRVQLLGTPWTAAYQAPPSMGFSRQEYWSGLPLPSPPLFLAASCFWVSSGFRRSSRDRARVWNKDSQDFDLDVSGVMGEKHTAQRTPIPIQIPQGESLQKMEANIEKSKIWEMEMEKLFCSHTWAPNQVLPEGFSPFYALMHSFYCLNQYGLGLWLLIVTCNLIIMVLVGFPGGSDGKEFACSAEDLGLIPGTGRSPEEGNSNPLPSQWQPKYSCLENPMDRGAWQAAVHRVTKSQKKLGTHSKNN